MSYRAQVTLPCASGEECLVILDLAKPPNTDMHELHGDNINTVELVCVTYLSLLADSPLFLRRPRDYKSFAKQLMADYRGVIAHNAKLADRLLSTLERDDQHPGHISAPYLVEFQKTPIYREYLEFYRSGNPELLQYILTFLWWGKKSHYSDPELQAAALRDWLAIEDKLTLLQLPAWTTNLKRVMDMFLTNFAIDTLVPKHGNGAVAERSIGGPLAKNQRFQMDSRLAYLYGEKWGDIIPPSISEGKHQSIDTRYLSPSGEKVPEPEPVASNRSKKKGRTTPEAVRPPDPSSRLMFVPKNYKSLRSVCMEPISRMWFQQAVRGSLERFIASSRLSNHIYLHDQTINQLAAMRASIGGHMDTIDLSAASDSVSWRLIKAIFPAVLLKHLQATRSQYVELPDGTEKYHRLAKFAPMGSALCFPIQCLVYTGITVMIELAETLKRDWRDCDAFADLSSEQIGQVYYSTYYSMHPSRYAPYVYGDDIVVSNTTTSSLVEALTSLGFSVNVGKSFRGTQAFRESCGGFYLLGEDVTPIINKIGQVNESVPLKTLTGIIDLANRCKDRNLVMTRKALIQFALLYPIDGVKPVNGKNPILFSKDPDAGMALLHDSPRNDHLRMRGPSTTSLNSSASRYQRVEYRCISIVAQEDDYLTWIGQAEMTWQFSFGSYVSWWYNRVSPPSGNAEEQDDAWSGEVCDLMRLRKCYDDPALGRRLREEAVTYAKSVKAQTGSRGYRDLQGVSYHWAWCPDR